MIAKLAKANNLITYLTVFTTFTLTALTGLCLYSFRSQPINENWNITEMLISYRGGFVRRGLPGSILKFIYDNFNLSPSLQLIILSITLYTLTILIWIAFIVNLHKSDRRNHKGGNHEWIKFILFNPSLIIFFVADGSIFRKDIWFIFASCVTLLIFRWSQSQADHGSSSLAKRIIFLSYFCLSGVILALSHEALALFIAIFSEAWYAARVIESLNRHNLADSRSSS